MMGLKSQQGLSYRNTTNFHKNPKAVTMTCSLERNYRDLLRKKTASKGYYAKLYKSNRERQIFICVLDEQNKQSK